MTKTITISYKEQTFCRKINIPDTIPFDLQKWIECLKIAFAIRITFLQWQQLDHLRIDTVPVYRNVPEWMRKEFNKQYKSKVAQMTHTVV